MNNITHFFSHIESAHSQIQIIKDFFVLITKGNHDFSLENHIFFIKTNKLMYHSASEITLLFPKLRIYLLLNNDDLIESYEKIKLDTNLIIFHQFPFYEKLLQILVEESNTILKKTMWYIWGGDLYFFQNMSHFSDNNLPIIEQLRRKIIPRFGYIGCWNYHDYKILKTHYGSKGKFLQAYYSTDINFQKIIQKTSFLEKRRTVKNILIGNSGNPSNNHIKLIKDIRHLREENIHLYFIFSYGGEEKYYHEVINILNKYFLNKFTIVYKFMDYKKYTEFLNKIDICIMHQERQQGAGLLLWLFLLKKKIYLNKSSSTYIHFTELGCHLFQSLSLENITYKELFLYNNKLLEINKEIILKEYDKKKLLNHWKKIFDQN